MLRDTRVVPTRNRMQRYFRCKAIPARTTCPSQSGDFFPRPEDINPSRISRRQINERPLAVNVHDRISVLNRPGNDMRDTRLLRFHERLQCRSDMAATRTSECLAQTLKAIVDIPV